MRHLTGHCAAEWAKYGIRANVVAPGPTATEGNRWPTREGRMEARRLTTIGVPSAVQDIVATVSFPSSDQARMITGQVIDVDGGFVCWPVGTREQDAAFASGLIARHAMRRRTQKCLKVASG